VFKVELTHEEIQFFHDTLARRKFYEPSYCPLGNPWNAWMSETMKRLEIYLNHV